MKVIGNKVSAVAVPLGLLLLSLLFVLVEVSWLNHMSGIDTGGLADYNVRNWRRFWSNSEHPPQPHAIGPDKEEYMTPAPAITDSRTALVVEPIVTSASFFPSAPAGTPMQQSIPVSTGNDFFPIAVIAHRRTIPLANCLASLLSLHGIQSGQITVYQDGNNPAVARVVQAFGTQVKLLQRTESVPITLVENRIARHYKFTLSHIFDTYPDAQYAILVEDDMVFSPDFLAFFHHLAPLYEKDPSIYCISSWNDNGFTGLVQDPTKLYRTDFFLGLGWLVSRKIYKGELEAKWPDRPWDMWMREPEQQRGRQCVYPEISRNFNVGNDGVHSSKTQHRQFFSHIVKNTQFPVQLEPWEQMHTERYDQRLSEQIQYGLQLSSMKKAFHHQQNSSSSPTDPSDRSLVSAIFFYQAHDVSDQIWSNYIAPYFGFWTWVPAIRGAYKGTHQFWWNNRHVILVASYSPYATLKRPDVSFLQDTDFGGVIVSGIGNRNISAVLAKAPGVSCDFVCKLNDKQCTPHGIGQINRALTWRAQLECEDGVAEGLDPVFPAKVLRNYTHLPTNEMYRPSFCYLNGAPETFSCSAANRRVLRLCPCY